MKQFNPADYKELRVNETSIPGLLGIDLVINGDSRGWFKESYQREKMVELGLPENFRVVQNNISYNAKRGVTRGIHAEPWEKFISIAFGHAFAAIVDLRAGDNFGVVETFELNPGKAIFVPRGCGNAYQALDEDTVYTYLVSDHWSPEAKYVSININDATLGIEWPIPLSQAEISEKDKANPSLGSIQPMEIS